MRKRFLLSAALLALSPAHAQNGQVFMGSSPLNSGVICSGGGVAQPCPNVPAVNAPLGLQRVLGSLRAANFNSTADQAIAIVGSVTAYQITSVVVTNCSTSLTLAAGGVYPATSKGGTAIVAATQVYTALTGTTVLLGLTVAATPLVTRYTAANVYLSLTTAQGGAATCDVYVVGTDLT
jgi:hypothetical protein